MRQRGFWFKRVLLLTILMTFAPVVLGFGSLWILSIETRRWPISFDAGIFPRSRWSPVGPSATMIRNRWLWTAYGPLGGQKLQLFLYAIVPEPSPSQVGTVIDPLRLNPDFSETMELSPEAIIQFPYFSMASDGKQAYLVGKAGEVVELYEDHLQVLTTRFAKQLIPSVTPPRNDLLHAVVAEGQLLTFVKTADGKHEVFQFQESSWNSQGNLELLDTSRVWLDSRSRQLFVPLPPQTDSASGTASNKASNVPGLPGVVGAPVESGTIKVITIDSHPFLFWHISDRLLFREGLGLGPFKQAESPAEPLKPLIDESASALGPTNVIGVTSDWTAVTDIGTSGSKWFPVAVGGKPAVILIDESKRGHPRGTAFQFDDGEWKEFASTDLPFASYHFNSGFLDDGSKSYLSTVTFAGRSRVLALEPSGFRLTSYAETSERPSWSVYLWYRQPPDVCVLLAVVLAWFQLSGVIVTAVSTILMRRDSVEYRYGKQAAELASIWSRGCARGIDVCLLLSVAGWVCYTRYESLRPDWESVLDAIQIHVYDDVNIVAISQIATSSLLALAVSFLLLVVMQGWLGFTPGKWICGLRVMRTTLRRCHVARSLYRDLLLFLECVWLLWWIPAILSIAFTNHRQRIGDLAADTIVIRARSLRPVE